MKLRDYDLRQIDKERIDILSETTVKNLSITLLNDLKKARERPNHNSKNSSMQLSNEAPWDTTSKYSDEEKDDESLDDIEALDKGIHTDTLSVANACHPDNIKRSRCWAHLVRKARGLTESYDKEAQALGKEALDFLNSLIGAIENAQLTPPEKPLSEIWKDHTTSYRHA